MYQSFIKLKKRILKISSALLNSSLAIQVGATLALVALCFIPAYREQLINNRNMAYAIARGAGATLKYLLPAIFIPTLRMLHAQAFKLIRKFPNTSIFAKLFHDRFTLHKILGVAILGAVGVHTLAHVANLSVGWMALESLTGLSMIACIALPIATMYLARAYQSHLAKLWQIGSYYAQFLIPHQIGWWGLITAFAFHTRDLRLLSLSLGIAGLFSFDRIWEWAASTNVNVQLIKKIHDKMIIIEVEKPKSYAYQPGDKAYLSYPIGSAFFNNLHPFTLASSPDENILRFVISDSGKWSHQLIQSLKADSTIRISPSFPSPLNLLQEKTPSDRLFISSGSGLAITLAHLHNKRDRMPIRIIHTTRHPREMFFLSQYIKDKNFAVEEIEYYDTSNSPKEESKSKNNSTSTRTFTNRFNPTHNNVLRKFKGNIFFCGSDGLGKAVEQCVAQDPDKKLYREKFGI